MDTQEIRRYRQLAKEQEDKEKKQREQEEEEKEQRGQEKAGTAKDSAAGVTETSKKPSKKPHATKRKEKEVENPTPITMILQKSTEVNPPVKKVRTEGGSSGSGFPTVDQAEKFLVNSPTTCYLAASAISSLALNLRGYAQWVESIGTENVQLREDISQKAKLIEDWGLELRRLKNEAFKKDSTIATLQESLKTMANSKKKLKAELEEARKSQDEADKMVTDRAATWEKEETELKMQQALAVDRGYQMCLEHIRATVPGFDATGYNFDSTVVDGKIVPYTE